MGCHLYIYIYIHTYIKNTMGDNGITVQLLETWSYEVVSASRLEGHFSAISKHQNFLI